jgi:predicted glycoside hydrolase/deacetylase ChbG (UPF0249 family)
MHVDDIGMCRAANEGGFEALRNGPATCGSVMVPCPWFPEAAAIARGEPAFDLGVHLTLNSEWAGYRWGPVAPRDQVPSLLDAEGYLPRTLIEVVKQAKPVEVEIELRAQIDRALAFGIDLTHLDSHMGTVLTPPFVGIYAKLAREFRLPVFVVHPRPEQLAARGLAGAEKVFGAVVDALAADGWPILDDFDIDSLGFAPGEGLAHNRKRLDRVGPGVTYLLCHAAKGGDELQAASGADAHAREFERTFYGGIDGRREFEKRGIKTVGMRALRELLRGKAR